ncbi:MAG: radical SAM family RiPP maturation amino acid epimerase [bacterium]|nr:radical SAM family RiPP maturation amino acid epimerase [bacterium]
MNEHEKSLATLSRAEMGEEEYARINHLVAETKRFVELLVMLPETKDEVEKHPEAFLQQHHLEHIRIEDMKLLAYEEYQKELEEILTAEDVMDRLPESVFRYRQFIGNKFVMRDKMRDELCVPSNKRLKKWRARQIERCKGGLGGVNLSFVHDVMNYELTVGCSVGCKFCGVGAKKLQKVFFHTEENAKLFRDVLKISHEIIGDAAGTGAMYLATEALDNPDYEKFEEDYFAEFGTIPQITTAVPLRDTERTHRFVAELYEKKAFIHRFSVRSLEQAREIFDEFTADELVLVELIPQYPEAPGFIPFTIAGRQREEVSEEEAKNANQPGSICCIDGFVVNMAEQSIRMISPCHSNEYHPDGVAGPEKVFFTDAEDYREKLTRLIDETMLIDVPTDVPLKIYPYFERKQTEHGDSIVSIYGGYVMAIEKIPYKGLSETITLLQTGAYTKEQIVEKLMTDYNIKPENGFWNLTQMWKYGVIVDPALFPEEYDKEA